MKVRLSYTFVKLAVKVLLQVKSLKVLDCIFTN